MNRICKEKSLGAVWAGAFTVETLAIIIANVFSKTIFWKRRIQLRRTRYLLLNLSVADLMFGVANLFELVVMKIWKALLLMGTSLWNGHMTFEDIFGSARHIISCRETVRCGLAVPSPYFIGKKLFKSHRGMLALCRASSFHRTNGSLWTNISSVICLVCFSKLFRLSHVDYLLIFSNLGT